MTPAQRLQTLARAHARKIRTPEDLDSALRRVPIKMEQRGAMLRASLVLPIHGKPTRFSAVVHLERDEPELGWFGSKLVRKAKKKVGGLRVVKTAKRAIKLGKKFAKSKLLKAVWKTMPLWANIVPPPAGQALAAGAAAAQLAIKVGKAAKDGHAGAKAFLTGIRKRKAHKAAVSHKAARAVLATRKLPPAKQAQVLRRLAQREGEYTVRTPTGRTIRVPAKKVAA